MGKQAGCCQGGRRCSRFHGTLSVESHVLIDVRCGVWQLCSLRRVLYMDLRAAVYGLLEERVVRESTLLWSDCQGSLFLKVLEGLCESGKER